MKINDSQIPALNPEFKLEQFDNEILLYSMAGTTAVYLNETGYLVWCLCSENRPIGKIIALLEEEYPEQRGYIRDDVISVINHLVENGVIVLNNE